MLWREREQHRVVSEVASGRLIEGNKAMLGGDEVAPRARHAVAGDLHEEIVASFSPANAMRATSSAVSGR